MANEITYQMQILLRNGNLVDNYASGSLTATQSAAVIVRNVQSIAAGVVGVGAGTALDLGSVATPGWSAFINTDATNYVQVGFNTGGLFYPMLKLLPGESQLIRLAIAAPYAMANVAPVSLFYIIYDT